MANFINLTNLKRGIEFLFSLHKKQNKPRRGKWDFHNSLYQQLHFKRRDGIDIHFWDFAVDELAKWKAIRGTKETTKDRIYQKGIRSIPDINHEYKSILASHNGVEPTLSQANWPELERLFSIATDMKGVDSPVFPSKLCHFILPDCFVVADRKLIGIHRTTYIKYWLSCKEQWSQCARKDELKAELERHIPGTVCQPYPWSTKIAEICHYDPECPF